MTNAQPNDNERGRDTADDHKDDELSTEELDNVTGGYGFGGPEAVAAGKGRGAVVGPEAASGKGFLGGGPEKAG